MISVAGVHGQLEDDFVDNFASWLSRKYPWGGVREYRSRIRNFCNHPNSIPDDQPENIVIKRIVERYKSNPLDLSLIQTFEAYESASNLEDANVSFLTHLARIWRGVAKGPPTDWQLASIILLPHLRKYFDTCRDPGDSDASCKTLHALAGSSPVVTAVAITGLRHSDHRLDVWVKLSRLSITQLAIVHLDEKGYEERVKFVYEQAGIQNLNCGDIYAIFDNFFRSRTYATIGDIVRDYQGHQPELIAAYVLSYVPLSSCQHGEGLLSDPKLDITDVEPYDQAGLACALSSGSDFQEKTSMLIEKTYQGDDYMVEKAKIITEYLGSIPAGTRKILGKTLQSLKSDPFNYGRILVELCTAGPARKPVLAATLAEVEEDDDIARLMSGAAKYVRTDLLNACLNGKKEKCVELCKHFDQYPIQALAATVEGTVTTQLLIASEIFLVSDQDWLKIAWNTLRTKHARDLLRELLAKLSDPRPFYELLAGYRPPSQAPPSVSTAPLLPPQSLEEELIGTSPDIEILRKYYGEKKANDDLVPLLVRLTLISAIPNLQPASPLQRLAAYISIEEEHLQGFLAKGVHIQLPQLKAMRATDMRLIGVLFEVSLIVKHNNALESVLNQLDDFSPIIHHLIQLRWTQRLNAYQAPLKDKEPTIQSTLKWLSAELLIVTKPEKTLLDLYFRAEGTEEFLRDRMRDRIDQKIWEACDNESTCEKVAGFIKKNIAISPLWIVVKTYPGKEEALLPRRLIGRISEKPDDGKLSLTVMMYGIIARMGEKKPIKGFWDDFAGGEYERLYKEIDALDRKTKLSILRTQDGLMKRGNIDSSWRAIVIYGPPKLDSLKHMQEQKVTLDMDGLAAKVVSDCCPHLFSENSDLPLWAKTLQERPFQALSLVIVKAGTNEKALSTLLGVEEEKMLLVSSSLNEKKMSPTVFFETIVARESQQFVSAINNFDSNLTPVIIDVLSGMDLPTRFDLYGKKEYLKLIDSPQQFLDKLKQPLRTENQLLEHELLEGRPPLALMIAYVKLEKEIAITDLIANRRRSVVPEDMKPGTPLKALAFSLYATEDQLQLVFRDEASIKNVKAIRSKSRIDDKRLAPKWDFVQVIYELLLLMRDVDDPFTFIIKRYDDLQPMTDHLGSGKMSQDVRYHFYHHATELSSSKDPDLTKVYAELLMFTKPSVLLVDTFLGRDHGNSEGLLKMMVSKLPEAHKQKFVEECEQVSPVWTLLLKKTEVIPGFHASLRNHDLIQDLLKGSLHEDVFLHELIKRAETHAEPLERFKEDYESTHYKSLLRGVSCLSRDKIKLLLIRHSEDLDPEARDGEALDWEALDPEARDGEALDQAEFIRGWRAILLLGPNIEALIEMNSESISLESVLARGLILPDEWRVLEDCTNNNSLPACEEIRSNPVRWLALVQNSGKKKAKSVGEVLGVAKENTGKIKDLASAIKSNEPAINLNVYLGQLLSNEVDAPNAMKHYDPVWTPAVTLFVDSQTDLSYKDKVTRAGSLEDPLERITSLLWAGFVPPLSILDSITNDKIISNIVKSKENREVVAKEIRGLVERCFRNKGPVADCDKLYSIQSKNILKSMFLLYDLEGVEWETVIRILKGRNPQHGVDSSLNGTLKLKGKTEDAIFKQLVELKLKDNKETKPLLTHLISFNKTNSGGWTSAGGVVKG